MSTPRMPRRERSKFFLWAARVKDKTRQRYRKAVNDFITWCDENNIEAERTRDLDWALSEYMHDEYERNDGRGRSHAAYVISGLQLFVPLFRGKLRLSAEALKGWTRIHPGRRHPPLTWSLAVAIAAQLARWGRFEMAVGTLLAFVSLLRIGELTSVRVGDFLDANSDDSRVDEVRVSGLRLRKTKTADNLFAEIHHEDVLTLLRRVVSHKHRSEKIFAFSAGSFRQWFKKAVSALHLDDRYVPHSLRHGGATLLYMAKVPIETILHRGRWASTKSARYYVQSGEAMLLAQSVNSTSRDFGRTVAADLVGTLLRFHRLNRHPVHVPRADVGSRASPAVASRHSTRQDWQVRPDYATLDDWSGS